MRLQALAEIRAQRQAQEAELVAARAGLIEQRFEIEALKSRLARLQRMTFGRSSEKLRDQVEQANGVSVLLWNTNIAFELIL